MNRLSSLIYNKVHTTGWLADAVYSGAYRFRHNWRRFRNWRAKQDLVKPDELYEHRHIGSIGIIAIGVTNICNARCVFCAYPRAMDNKDIKGGVMPMATFKKVVDEWAAVGGTSIDLTHTVGDPLVDPGLVDKVKYATTEAGMTFVSFTTNGILLDRHENYKRLIEAGTSAIYISTSGTDKESYEKVYGVNHYAEMLSGVHHLLEYNRSKGEPINIGIRFRNSLKPSEIMRTDDFIRHVKPYLSDKVRWNFTADYDNWGGLIKGEDMFDNMKLRGVQERVDVPCRYLFGYTVRYDGSVRMCGCRFKRTDMDDMVVGNLNQGSLLDISRNSKAWDIIKGFYEGKRPDTCQGCTLYDPINRAWLEERRRNFAETKQHQALRLEKAQSKPGGLAGTPAADQPEKCAPAIK